MDSIKDSITFWVTVLGTLVGLFGAFESRAWLVVVGSLIACGSIAVLIYAERQRVLVKSAMISVGELSIDSLNLASLRRRLNRNLVIQTAQNLAVIDGEDLEVTWRCSGYCRAVRETAIEFSIDADANIPFGELECVAFDLRRDPRRLHPIYPVLVGSDGISKKVAVPFLAPLSAKEPFSVVITYRLPHCMKAGIDYYTATLSFAQDNVHEFSARLRFLHGKPQWVRAYECLLAGAPKILKDLRPRSAEAGALEYMDSDEDVPARCARIYLFSRPALAERETSPMRQTRQPVER